LSESAATLAPLGSRMSALRKLSPVTLLRRTGAGENSHFFQIAFLDDAFVRLTHALDTVLLLAAIIGKLPNDLVVAVGRRLIGKATGEANRLS
jgi:hypothetical protein